MLIGIVILLLIRIGIGCFYGLVLVEFPLDNTSYLLSFSMVFGFMGLTHPQLHWIHMIQVKANLPFHLPRSGIAT